MCLFSGEQLRERERERKRERERERVVRFRSANCTFMMRAEKSWSKEEVSTDDYK